MDIKQIAEQLIVQLWAESDRLRERAEGVKLFLHTIITEAEKENGRQEEQIADIGNNPAQEKQD